MHHTSGQQGPCLAATSRKAATATAKASGHLLSVACVLQIKYKEALDVAPESSSAKRAVYHSNISAVHLKQRAWAEAAQAASKALELDEKYIKALMRRATAYQELDDLEHALADYQKVPTHTDMRWRGQGRHSWARIHIHSHLHCWNPGCSRPPHPCHARLDTSGS